MTEMMASSVDDELEKRIEALEIGVAYDATQTAVHQVQAECLMKLREIRAALVAEASSTNGATSGAAVAATAVSSSKEMQNLLTENEELKRKIAKLEYRVQHMVTSMEELYERTKTAECRATF